jgi:peptide/nickel transport system ATP-binding protein
MEEKPILEVNDLTVSFRRFEPKVGMTDLEVIRSLNVTVGRSELVAVAGSSGSGKSLLAQAILGILPTNCGASGNIHFNGELMNSEKIRAKRGKEIVLVPQSVTYLDPLETVGAQVRLERADEKSIGRQRELFSYYGLKKETETLYPFELSGGMARRVLLSAAMMDTPSLIIADEPTPGLHLTAAKKAMRHFRDFADQGNGVLLITHDLELALEAADKIAVFYAGTTVEVARASDFKSADLLRHPYTKALWHALPQNGFASHPGNQPYPGKFANGCPFTPRCGLLSTQCSIEVPPRQLRGGLVRCIHAV